MKTCLPGDAQVQAVEKAPLSLAFGGSSAEAPVTATG